MKLAAAFKMNRMVRNAVNIHKAADFEHGAGPSSNKDSSYGRALLAYTKVQDKKEEFGGWCWCWKQVITGAINRDEGIWLNNRMLQGNASQVFICIWMIPFLSFAVKVIQEIYDFVLVEIVQVCPCGIISAFYLSLFVAQPVSTNHLHSRHWSGM